MGTDSDWLVGVLLALALATLFAALLTRGRIAGGRPAAAIAGGLIAGVLLGPAVLGSALPDGHRSWIAGGGAEHAEIVELEADHGAERAALEASGVSPAAIDERVTAQQAELAPVLRSQRRAEDDHTRLQLYAPIALLALSLLVAGAGAPSRPERADDPIGPGLGSGLLAVAFSALPTYWLLEQLCGLPFRVAAALAACAAGASILPGVLLRATPEHGRGSGVESAHAGALACAAVGLGAVAPAAQPWAAVIAGGALTGLILRTLRRNRPRIVRVLARRARAAALGCAVPGCVALVTARLDPAALVESGGVLWFALVAVFVAGDGQIIGGALGWMTFGSDAQRGRGLRRGIEQSAGAGLGVAALTSCAVAAGVINVDVPAQAGAALALLLCAAAIELMVPLARWAPEVA